VAAGDGTPADIVACYKQFAGQRPRSPELDPMTAETIAEVKTAMRDCT
jgi:hypothetical protein